MRFHPNTLVRERHARTVGTGTRHDRSAPQPPRNVRQRKSRRETPSGGKRAAAETFAGALCGGRGMRRSCRVPTGPRAGLGLLRAARAWALVHDRDYVLPEDVQAVWPSVAEHRLQPREGGQVSAMTQALLQTVPVVRH